MNKQTLQQIIQLTQDCLAHFWQMDAEFVIRHFDKDIVWIGSAQSQYTEGYEAAAADYRSIMKELKPCHLMRQEFAVVQNAGNACAIAGRYLTTTDDEVGYFLQVQQRCTFVWELVRGEPKLKHCHISNPMGELKLAEGERFPNVLGQMSQRYRAQKIRQAQDARRIVVTDSGDVVHFLLPSEVIYVTAQGRSCVIHTLGGRQISARMSITDFQSAAGDGFSAVHRSYSLNDAYISHIQKYEVVMADGSRIPIPVKRYKEIREELAALYDIPAADA